MQALFFCGRAQRDTPKKKSKYSKGARAKRTCEIFIFYCFPCFFPLSCPSWLGHSLCFFPAGLWAVSHKKKVLAPNWCPFEFSTGAVVGHSVCFLCAPSPLCPHPETPGQGKGGAPATYLCIWTQTY